jgi:hypothetical protein
MGDKDSTQPVENKSPEGEAPPGDILPASHWEEVSVTCVVQGMRLVLALNGN